MELHLVVPALPGDKHVEVINGREWCVKGPIDIHHEDRTKFHCVSYVWGFGREKVGGLFNSQIEISDQTRPALEAAIRAIKVAQEGKGEMIEAFWIDAICVPQKDGRAREATLESMGFIYSAAESVIVVLQAPTWAIIKSATAGSVHDFIQYDELKVLERAEWIKSPWTYQEIVNSNAILFTALVVPGAPAEDVAINGSPFLNCVGLSLDRWKKQFKKPEMEVLAEFRNLSALADTLADAEMSGYLDRTALCVLSNIGQRRYNPQFPKNSLLAALGALTKDVSWGDPAESVSELAEKVMETCEMNNDFSFIYTADQRDQTPGKEWRPDPQQADFDTLKPMHLIPIIKWYSWGEKQGGRKDGQGFWLENMVPLKKSAVTNNAGIEYILRWIQGSEAFCEDGGVPAPGFSKWQQGQGVNFEEAVLDSLKAIGFTGSDSYQRCENGLFFSQQLLEGRRKVEMFAASSIRWNFGSPGIARWEDNGDTRYCAGVFAGDILNAATQQLLLCW